MKLTGKNFEVDINMASTEALMAEIARRFDAGTGFALATINLDHVTKLESDATFRSAYAAHDLVVADGNPIVWISRLARARVELIPGSELVIPLAKLAAKMGVGIALIGSSEDSLAAAGRVLQKQAAGLSIVYIHAPAFGFDPEGQAAQGILNELNSSGAGLAFLALGAPKQERFAALGRTLAPNVGFASIGAGLDFLSGAQVRAPLWARKIAMEWLWRMLGNPKRMFKRYAISALALPGLALRNARKR